MDKPVLKHLLHRYPRTPAKFHSKDIRPSESFHSPLEHIFIHRQAVTFECSTSFELNTTLHNQFETLSCPI